MLLPLNHSPSLELSSGEVIVLQKTRSSMTTSPRGFAMLRNLLLTEAGYLGDNLFLQRLHYEVTGRLFENMFHQL